MSMKPKVQVLPLPHLGCVTLAITYNSRYDNFHRKYQPVLKVSFL